MVRRLLPLSLLALLLLTPCAILAKGIPTHVMIYGPGLPGRVDITDPSRLSLLGTAGLEQVPTTIPAPPVTGPGYEIERGGFDRVRYYPDPAGGRGFVYYVGIINGSSEYDGHWYYASAGGEQALRSILTEYGVRLAGTLASSPTAATALGTSVASTAPTASAVTARPSDGHGIAWSAIIATIVVGGMLIAGGLLQYRRRYRTNRRAAV